MEIPEPGLIISLAQLVSYSAGAIVAFLIPYLVWLHNRVMENKQAIAVNTANDKTTAESIKSILNEIHQINENVSRLREDFAGIKGKIK